jgi:hypothetical protein
MEGPPASTSPCGAPADAAGGLGLALPAWPGAALTPSWLRADLRRLLFLIAVSAAVHACQIWRTEVMARDGIGFIRYAWQLEQHPWPEVIRQSEQHPGYPLTVLAVSLPVRALLDLSEPSAMQLSAQLASTLAGLLLIIPMYYLGAELFDRRVGFWAALVFQVLPASSRVLADCLSEGAFLLWAATALWLAGRALRTGSVACFGLAGLVSALAYLTRPEGTAIAAATLAVLLVLQAVPRWSWSRTAACAAALSVGFFVVGGPYLLAAGRLTTKPTANLLLAEVRPVEPVSAAPGQPLLATALAVWWEGPPTDAAGRAGWGVRALGRELITGSHYVLWFPALVGLWCFRGRLRTVPGAWVVLLVCAALAVALWRVAVVAGYLSDRHTLLLVLCGTFWAVAGLGLFAGWLAWLAGAVAGVRSSFASPTRWGLVLLLAVVGSALPRTLERLHGNRSGFRDVGNWLAEHTHPADEVIDPYFWSHYYSGRVFQEGGRTTPPPGHRPTRYVVLERAGLEHVRLALLPEAERLAKQGQVVHRWWGKRRKVWVEIVVVAVNDH